MESFRQHPVDWLIASDPTYGDTAFSAWDGKYDDPFLTELAESIAKWPGVYDRLARALVLGAQWTCRQKSKSFFSLADLDRRKSFAGGLPWTCDKYPWPQENGRWLSPLVQVNLSELPLDPIATFPAILLQVWGNQIDMPVVREIPLSDIVNQVPDKVMKPWHDEHHCYEYKAVGFDWQKPAPTDLSAYETAGQRVGEYISVAGHWKFCLGLELGNWLDDPDVVADWYGDPAMSETVHKFESDQHRLFELERNAPQMNNMTGYWEGAGRFGGQMESYQSGYEESLPAKNLLTPKASGLSILGDGNLNILWLEKDGKIEFDAYSDR